MSKIKFDLADMCELGGALKNNSSLLELKLQNNFCNDELKIDKLKILCENLGKNLKKIDLSANHWCD